MESTVPIAIGIGCAAGTLCGYLLGKRAILRIATGPGRHTLIAWLGLTGGLLAVFPAFFLGMVVGGNLGGGFGAVAAQPFGLEKLGIPIGIAIGLCLVVAILITLGASAGALLGRGIEAISSRDGAI